MASPTCYLNVGYTHMLFVVNRRRVFLSHFQFYLWLGTISLFSSLLGLFIYFIFHFMQRLVSISFTELLIPPPSPTTVSRDPMKSASLASPYISANSLHDTLPQKVSYVLYSLPLSGSLSLL